MLQDTFKIFCISQHSKVIYQFENNNNLPSKKTSVYHWHEMKDFTVLDLCENQNKQTNRLFITKLYLL